MGHFPVADVPSHIRIFASPQSWIEDAARRQLQLMAERNGVVAVAGMPDLHPGHHGPVGCAMLAEGVVHADVIGNDIGCGMQLWRTELHERHIKLDKAVERLAALEGPWSGDAIAALESETIVAGEFANALGTVGGGNHFCEVQAVQEIVDVEAASKLDLARGRVVVLVHSGSRGLGTATLQAHYKDGIAGLGEPQAIDAYLKDHDNALRYARLNRAVIAGRALQALRCEGTHLLDVPHNLVERRADGFLHRKGAAPSDRGLVPLPGSRGAVTYLVAPTNTVPEALASIAHGAGRKHDRASMQRRVRNGAGTIERLQRTPLGSRVVCSDRQLLVEEAPEAYKDVEAVVADLEAEGLARLVAIMRPLVTFKTARDFSEKKRRDQWREERQVRS